MREEKKWKDQDEEYEGRGWVTRGLRNFQSGSISPSHFLLGYINDGLISFSFYQ